MEIVIDIPDEEYRWIIKSDETVFANVASKEGMLHAIKNGTPLPKHHGRLIDADELKTYADSRWSESASDGCEYYVEVSDIDNAPTIIEGSDSE